MVAMKVMLVVLAGRQLAEVVKEVLPLAALPAMETLVVRHSENAIGKQRLQNTIAGLDHGTFQNR